MAARIEQLAKDLRERFSHIAGLSDIADTISAQAPLARELGVPEDFPHDIFPAKKSDASEGHKDSLLQAVKEFKTNPLTPELVTATFQTLWHVRGESVGVEVVVSPCDRSAQELAELTKAGRRIGYLPEQAGTQKDRPLLAKMFPQLRSYSVEEGNPVVNEANRSGWFDYEASIDAPYVNTTEDQLRKKVTEEARLGMNLNEYIVASEDSKLFTGKFLDQDSTWVRLLGSRRDGGVVSADFGSGGYVDVYSLLKSGNHDPFLGGRSVGVKKA